MGGRLNLVGGTLNLDGGTRPPGRPNNLSTDYNRKSTYKLNCTLKLQQKLRYKKVQLF